jgi:acyl-[acyl-carrier-protein]-phospholipid O-acyltransferase / long-chain-fatty-acid--[acyl-carrier-protein] ligase
MKNEVSVFSRGFAPFFLTVCSGAFNDSIIRRAVEMQILFVLVSDKAYGEKLIFFLLALFVFPFFSCSAFAGYLADSRAQGTLIRIIKGAEVVIVAVASYGLLSGSLSVCTAAILLLGIHSAFYGPIKYALPTKLLSSESLARGNGQIGAGTNLAILGGTLLASMLAIVPSGDFILGIPLPTSGLLLICLISFTASVLGFIASFNIPLSPPDGTKVATRRSTRQLIGVLIARPQLRRIVGGISWFWSLGAVMLSLFPVLQKTYFDGYTNLITIFFMVFSVGVGVGSVLYDKVTKGRIETTWIPIASFVMALGLLLFWVATVLLTSPIHSLSSLFFTARGLLLLSSLFITSAASGFYSVPLYSILQVSVEAHERAQFVAANNIMNALYMVLVSLAVGVLFQLHFSSGDILLLLVGGNILAALVASLLLPEALFRSVLLLIFKTAFRTEIKGLSHLDSCQEKTLIVANHLSFLDALLLGCVLPGKCTFAVNSHIAAQWWMAPVMKLFDALPLDPSSPMAIRTLIDRINDKQRVIIFPEGRITVTGALMKVYEGPAVIADKTKCDLLPIRIEGLQYTFFSRLKGVTKLSLFPKVTLTVTPPRTLDVADALKGKKRREILVARLHDLMTETFFATTPRPTTLLEALRTSAGSFGGATTAVKDATGSLTYQTLIKRSFLLNELVALPYAPGALTGVLLPNTTTLVATFFGIQWGGRVPALINFSHSPQQMVDCCKAAGLTHILTSRAFINAGQLFEHVDTLAIECAVTFVYLEDVKGASVMTKVRALLAWYSQRIKKCYAADSEATAVVLFTSGSEGSPKGVALSHTNILSNIDQVTSVIPLFRKDKVFNALPMFHSFGLTAGTLMPLFKGVPVFLYPSPLHYRIIPELVYGETSSILFGTPTFLAGYAKKAHPYDFFNVRYIFAGAERLQESIRALYQEKFGVRIFEGYGTTETSPVVAVNTPFYSQSRTVGRLLPGIEARLEKVEGVNEGGRLLVKGPNVMRGYYKVQTPGVLQPLEGGWYDTGDIVTITVEGFISIRGRAKRFAKIAGEMISLSSIEEALIKAWPHAAVAAISIPDERKGEAIVVATTYLQATREEMVKVLRQADLPELAWPRRITILPHIPLLGSGKTDYQSLTLLLLGEPTHEASQNVGSHL